MTSHRPPSTAIALTADTLPDAYLDQDHVVLELTTPGAAGGTDAVVRIPLEWAEEWAIDAYTSIMAAYRTAAADVPLVETPPPGDPHGDGSCSSSLASRS